MGIHPNTPSELPDGINLGSKLPSGLHSVSQGAPWGLTGRTGSSAAPVCHTQPSPGLVTGSIPTSSCPGRSPEGVFTVSGVLGEITTECCLSACPTPFPQGCLKHPCPEIQECPEPTFLLSKDPCSSWGAERSRTALHLSQEVSVGSTPGLLCSLFLRGKGLESFSHYPLGPLSHLQQRWEPQEIRFLTPMNSACNWSCPPQALAFPSSLFSPSSPSTISRSWRGGAWTLTTRRRDRARSRMRSSGRPWRSLRSPRKWQRPACTTSWRQM